MPELPEVETVCRRIAPLLEGRKIVAVQIDKPQVSKPIAPEIFANQLVGRKIDHVSRRAKNVLIHFADENVLRIHFNMTGNLVFSEPEDRHKYARAWFHLDEGPELVYIDPRILGHMWLYDPAQLKKFDQSLGIEPLSSEFTSSWLKNRVARINKPAKLFLTDQAYVVGLGNIWAAEALFEARIHPEVPINSLSSRKITALHAAIVAVLKAAVKSAYRGYTAPGETDESDGFNVAVYQREEKPCVRCGRSIQRITQDGRSTYFCAHCQR